MRTGGKFRPSGQGSVRLFGSAWAERLSRARPCTVLGIWGPLIALLLVHGLGRGPSAAGAVAAAAGGVAAWSLTEYLTHRFLFHLRARSPLLARLIFVLHGNHHLVPADPTRNVMPPVVSVPAGVVVYALALAALGPPLADIFTASMALGYLGYDLGHFHYHQGRPRTAMGRYLRRHHLRHHYGAQPGNYGVSSPFWDLVFGTYLWHRRPQERRS